MSRFFRSLVASSDYLIDVVIEGKPGARDPEGEVIQRDLIWKNGFESVKSVRVAKLLKIVIQAKSAKEAKMIVQRLCDELRIFNPAAHSVHVALGKSQD